MVRVGPDASDEALAKSHTRIFDMTGRPMKGWILVGVEGFATKRQLGAWVRRGVGVCTDPPSEGVMGLSAVLARHKARQGSAPSGAPATRSAKKSLDNIFSVI
jgi:hypothetical protein